MFNIDVLITGGIGICTTIIGSWTSWFFARKKYNSEVDHNVIENMKASLEFYTKLSDDNTHRLEALAKRNEELDKVNAEATKQNQILREEIHELRKQVLNLTLNICMDLTCADRVRDLKNKIINGKNKDRFDQSPEHSKR